MAIKCPTEARTSRLSVEHDQYGVTRCDVLASRLSVDTVAACNIINMCCLLGYQ